MAYRIQLIIFFIIACLCNSMHCMRRVWSSQETRVISSEPADRISASTQSTDSELTRGSIAPRRFVEALFKAPDQIPLLLQEGADPNAVAIYHHASSVSSYSQPLSSTEYSHGQRVIRHVLHIAIRVSPVHTIEALLQAGSDANALDFDETPALHIASRAKRDCCPVCQPSHCRCRPNILMHLLSYGAHPNARDNQGKTALHHTLKGLHGNVEEATILLRYGANPFLDTPDTGSPLAYAALRGRTRRVEQMLNETRIPLDIAHITRVREMVRINSLNHTQTQQSYRATNTHTTTSPNTAASMQQISRLLHDAERRARRGTGCHCVVQ